MKRQKLFFYSSLAITLSSILLLASGSSWLLIALDDDSSIPSGTFITWAGMIALPLSIYWGVKEFRTPSTLFNKVLSGLLTLLITLGILWVPLSFLLAGNLSFSFTEKESFQGGQAAMMWFWRLSYGIGIGAVLTLIVYWFSLLFQSIAKSKVN